MASASDLDRVTMIVLRHLRKPFFVIVLVYAIGIIGMALIPGRDAAGNTEYMNLFHAFYFFTYTATTTGFGEIPHEFSDEQRLWAIVCLYTGAFAWFYAIGAIIRLFQNPNFISAVNERGFARIVQRITEPYYIICGFGDTGSLLARGLSDHHLGGVVIDQDPERIKALALRDYTVKMPGLCADAGVPKHLVDAGVQNSNCRAVIVLINDEDVVLKIAVMAKFLNPEVRVICRVTSPRHKEHLSTLKGVTVVDAFEIFAQLLSMAIANPALHNLNSWLVGARGVRLGSPLDVPTGDWIICGYGRMGHWLNRYLTDAGIRTVIIDPDVEDEPDDARVIRAHADRAVLQEAGIEHVAGVVACTDSDSGNLSILLNTQALNPDAFAVARQNSHANQLAFDAARADLTLQASLTTARRVLKLLISPLIQALIDHLRDADLESTNRVVRRLQSAVGDEVPHLWRLNVCREETAAAHELLETGQDVTFGDLMRDPNRSQESLSCVALMVERRGEYMMLPAAGDRIEAGDEIVFCGTGRSEHLVLSTANNPYTLHYLVTGTELPRGYFFGWLSRVKARAG